MKKELFLIAVVSLLVFAACSSEDKEIGQLVKNTTTTVVIQNLTEPAPAEPVQNATVPANQSENSTQEPVQAPMPSKPMKIDFFGLEGHSTLIQTPSGKNILIDGGTNREGLYLVKYFAAAGMHLSKIFASNTMEKNIGGLDSVVLNFNETDSYDVGPAQVGGVNNAYLNYVHYAGYYSKSLSTIDSDISFELNPAKLEVFVPEGQNDSSAQDSTLVFKATYGDVSVLMLGDCSDKCLDSLSSKNLKAEVVRAASFSQKMLEASNPRIIVLDKPDNTINISSKIYSTSNSTIEIEIDGTDVKVVELAEIG